MTLFEPSLRLRTLRVTREGLIVYDEEFSPGVNALHGQNSSGKSSIADLIGYALGASPPEWTRAAASCDAVYAEVIIGDEPVTLRRFIEDKPQRPMDIFWGSIEEASASEGRDWKRYPYAISANKESFSQVLFQALGIPEVQAELAERITIHQLLRLIWMDQRTGPGHLFRFEQFDSYGTREAVGDVLCGVYDQLLYELEIERKEKQSQLQGLREQLKSLRELMSEAGEEVLSSGMLREKLENRRSERESIYDSLRELKDEENIAGRNQSDVEDKETSLRNQLSEQRDKVRELRDELSHLDYEIADSTDFISALERRLKSLQRAKVTQEELGEAKFEYCPACYAKLDDATEEGDECYLCNNTLESSERRPHLLRLQNELRLQLEESRRIQEERRGRRSKISDVLPNEVEELERLQLEYEEATESVKTQLQDEAAELYQRLGYLNREIDAIQQEIRLASRLDSLSSRRKQLSAEIEEVSDEIEARRSMREDKKSKAYSGIADLIADLLQEDLPREEAFREAERVEFDFGKDALTVNGRSNFSASSMAYLYNSFHLALLFASTRLEFFRYPRFAIIDQIEDKGMEDERSHNLQQTVLEMSEKADVEHQLIFTTKTLAPALEDAGIQVGRYFTEERKSLQLSGIE